MIKAKIKIYYLYMLNIISPSLPSFAYDLKTEQLETSFEAEPIYQFKGRRQMKAH